MGSFTSTPRILNNDVLDHDVNFAKSTSRTELLQHCQRQPKVHPMVKRSFRKIKFPDLDYGLKVRKLNTMTKGTVYICMSYCNREQGYIKFMFFSLMEHPVLILNLTVPLWLLQCMLIQSDTLFLKIYVKCNVLNLL